jgi:hypothetical protein
MASLVDDDLEMRAAPTPRSKNKIPARLWVNICSTACSIGFDTLLPQSRDIQAVVLARDVTWFLVEWLDLEW